MTLKPYPRSLILRAAMPGDEIDVAKVHVRSWQAAYRGLLSDAYLDQLRAEERAERYDFATDDLTKPRTLVAVDDGTVQGFATTMPSRENDLKDWGELCALYVHPTYWGLGVGYALVAAARQHILSLGHKSAYLWLLEGNVRGDRFYCKDGWRCDGIRRKDTVWGVMVNEVRYLRDL